VGGILSWAPRSMGKYRPLREEAPSRKPAHNRKARNQNFVGPGEKVAGGRVEGGKAALFLKFRTVSLN